VVEQEALLSSGSGSSTWPAEVRGEVAQVRLLLDAESGSEGDGRPPSPPSTAKMRSPDSAAPQLLDVLDSFA